MIQETFFDSGRFTMAYIPNILTLLRLIMVPVFVAVFAVFPDTPVIALAVYALAMLTDALDGKIARAYNCISTFGTLVDPLADKLMTLAAVVCIASAGIIPRLAMILVAIREVAMIVIGAFAARANIVIPACWPGKLATVLFTAAFVLLFPWHGVALITTAAKWMLYVAIVAAFYAAGYYSVILIKRLRAKVRV